MDNLIIAIVLIGIGSILMTISVNNSIKISYDDLHMINTVSNIYCKNNKGVDYINIEEKTINVKCKNNAFFEKVEYRTK